MEMELPIYVRTLMNLLYGAGYRAHAVGGCVRDALRGQAPHDYDLTTDATPAQMEDVFAAAGLRTLPTGIAHGTLTVLCDGVPVEITTYRVDGDYPDGRHPSDVTFTRSLQEDLARRDFTVNAMAYSPKEGLCDPFGGAADLQAGLLRAVGEPEKRFEEDALRILRGLRFASVLGFAIEAQTAAAMRDCRTLLDRIAGERIREELFRLLCGEACVPVLREYREILFTLFPCLAPLYGLDQHNSWHIYDVWEHTLHTVQATPPNPVLRLAALFHDCGKADTFTLDASGVGHFYGHAEASLAHLTEVFALLKPDNETRAQVTTLVQYHDLPAPENDRVLRRRLAQFTPAGFDRLLLLQRADNLAQSPRAAYRVAEIDALRQKTATIAAAGTCLSLHDLRFGGEDLAALGVPRGPEMGRMLHILLDRVLDGDVENTPDALRTAAQALLHPPLEIERKYLIRMPAPALLQEKGGVASRIVQTYLTAPAGITERVRERQYPDHTEYTHTSKVRQSDLVCHEEEESLSATQYEMLLCRADPTLHPIEKTRVCIPYEGHTLEIDLYPFWDRQAVLEIELTDERDTCVPPVWLTVLREVTGDRAYKNRALAKHIPPQEG